MFTEKDIDDRKITFYGDVLADNLFLQPVDEHDAELMESEAAALAAMCGHKNWCIATIPITKWNEELTPWENKPVFVKEPFGEGASDTLSYICDHVLPDIKESYPNESRLTFLCGYSLAGLFALWSAYQTDIFAGIAAVSPSVWYPGWIEYASANSVKAPRIYLSLGLKEEKARNKVMATVGDAIRKQYSLLTEAGITSTLEWNQGNHFVDSDTRTAKGLAWLLNEQRGKL